MNKLKIIGPFKDVSKRVAYFMCINAVDCIPE